MELRFQFFVAITERGKQFPLSMAIGNEELMHECCPQHLRMKTVKKKLLRKDTADEGKK